MARNGALREFVARRLRRAPIIEPLWNEYERMTAAHDHALAERDAAVAAAAVARTERDAAVKACSAAFASSDRLTCPAENEELHLSGLLDPAVYQDSNWMSLHADLETYSIDKHVFYTTEGNIYRKGWEWTHFLYGLERLGGLRPDAKGLGVGVGHEPTIFYLGERVGAIVATDLYGGAEWAANEASGDVLCRPQEFCPRPVDLSRIRFLNVDGRDLPFPDDSFDFCWSLSSIEHFGGHEAAAEAVREIARVTRPGGIVCIATEYILLNDQDHPEFFNYEKFNKYILNASPELQLVDDIRYDTLPREYLIDSVPIPQNHTRLRRAVVLNNGEVQWTSIIFFTRKRVEV